METTGTAGAEFMMFISAGSEWEDDILHELEESSSVQLSPSSPSSIVSSSFEEVLL